MPNEKYARFLVIVAMIGATLAYFFPPDFSFIFGGFNPPPAK